MAETVSTVRAFAELGSLYLSVVVLREEVTDLKAAIERLKQQNALLAAELEKRPAVVADEEGPASPTT